MDGMDGAVEYFIDDPGEIYAKSNHSPTELSLGALSYNDDDEVDEDQSTTSVRMKSHPVNVRELKWSTQDGTSHARGEFSYFIDDLPIKRDISRDVDLEELVDLEYVTEGSSSHIFSAIWRDEQVIVKMLQVDKADDILAIHEFDIEGELLSRLEHPNIIRVLGAGTLPRPFLILERLRDLSKLLDLDKIITPRKGIFSRGPFTFLEMLQLAKDLADALAYTQELVHPDAMIVHRDLKPENLGLTTDRKLKLFDFGLCRCVKKRSSDDQAYEMTGNTGSLRYMAPEVVLNQQYTEKVDVYSFAIVIWTIASNKSPYKGFDRAMHLSRVVINGERPKLDNAWPADFNDLLQSCWHQNSSMRPPFSEITAQLDIIRDEYTKQAKILTKGRSFLGRLSFNSKKSSV